MSISTLDVIAALTIIEVGLTVVAVVLKVVDVIAGGRL